LGWILTAERQHKPIPWVVREGHTLQERRGNPKGYSRERILEQWTYLGLPTDTLRPNPPPG
jgi:hypothetical protein